jgi:hypothetical protein
MADIMKALRLWLLRVDEWLKNLSPVGRTTLTVFLAALLIGAAYFGLLPGKHIWPNSHAIFNW